jgi:hypothetical protein
MNKTQSAQYIEDVHGTIIGDTYSTGQLFYEGRPQGPRFSGTEKEVRDAALSYFDKLKTELGPEFRRLYPAGLELKIWE